MPKTNRRRTTHRKRTSQRKRKNVKRGVLHNMRGGFTYNKYVNIIKDQNPAYNSLLPFANNFPTEDNVKEVYQRIVDRTIPSDNISIYGKNYGNYVALSWKISIARLVPNRLWKFVALYGKKVSIIDRNNLK